MVSHLLQMRGLKLITGGTATKKRESHLLQMRGLKPIYWNVENDGERVASFTDAWIETEAVADSGLFSTSHLLQMRGLKHCYRQ